MKPTKRKQTKRVRKEPTFFCSGVRRKANDITIARKQPKQAVKNVGSRNTKKKAICNKATCTGAISRGARKGFTDDSPGVNIKCKD